MVRTKFHVKSITTHFYGNTEVNLSRVPADDENHDNAAFERIDSGDISLNIRNGEAARGFVVGKEYYVDFTRITELVAED